MLRSTRNYIPYPNMTVLEDVLTRSKNEGLYTYSPFPSMEDLIDEQFRGKERERYNFEEMIAYCADYELDPTKVNRSEELFGMELVDKRNAGFTTLESMKDDVSLARAWFRSEIIGYKTHDNSPYKQEQGYDTWLLVNDEGEEIVENEKLTVRNEYDADTFNKIVNELPFLLKMIWNRSKLMNAHLISFVRAYAILKSQKPEASITPKDFEGFTLIRLKSNGAYDREFDHEQDNKGVHYPAARRFILGQNPYDETYKACMKLITYFDILGLKWENENPIEYTNEFMNRLICTYLPKNEEYFQTFGNLDSEVANALKPENIFRLGNRVSFFSSGITTRSTKQEVLRYIKDCIATKKITDPEMFNNWDRKRVSLTYEFISAYLNQDNPSPRPLAQGFECIDGIVYFKRELFTRKANTVGEFRNEIPEMVFTEYGFVVVLQERFDGVYYVPVEECMERLQKFKENRFYAMGWYSL